MAATDDVLTAFRTAWAADAALQASFAGGPRGGDIPSPLAVPYCHAKAEQHQDPEYSTGGYGIHWVRITLTVYGLYAAANTILGQIAAEFEHACPGTAKTLSVPNSTHMGTFPLTPGVLVKDEARKDGDEIWKGVVEYVVMLQRATP